MIPSSDRTNRSRIARFRRSQPGPEPGCPRGRVWREPHGSAPSHTEPRPSRPAPRLPLDPWNGTAGSRADCPTWTKKCNRGSLAALIESDESRRGDWPALIRGQESLSSATETPPGRFARHTDYRTNPMPRDSTPTWPRKSSGESYPSREDSGTDSNLLDQAFRGHRSRQIPRRSLRSHSI